MKRILNQIVWEFFALLFFILLLTNSKECITYASEGLLIWYRNMIPTLFPFMILSGFMVQSGLSIKIGQWIRPFLGLFFHLPSQMLYVIFMGFLCGFPMGAKVIVDMLQNKQITLKQGEYLLTFCNNIGPLYMLGYVMPLFSYKKAGILIGCMYLVPFVYGVLLPFFSPHILSEESSFQNTKNTAFLTSTESPRGVKNKKIDYADCFRHSLTCAIEQITLLGGCMIFFNCFQILPKCILNFFISPIKEIPSEILSAFFSACMEIGGGLKQLSAFLSLASESGNLFLILSLLTFGGLSCIAQTYFIIKNSGLKLNTYLKHKFLQSCIFLILYLLF